MLYGFFLVHSQVIILINVAIRRKGWEIKEVSDPHLNSIINAMLCNNTNFEHFTMYGMCFEV